MSDYEILIALGHSAQKAAEIVLDANRNDTYARTWISVCRSFYEGHKKPETTQ
jgi:hypothetical protein